jgi:hypothetical protein
MLKGLIVAAILTVAGAVPALAQASCVLPIAPAAPDPRTATQDQMVAAVGDAKAFIAQSDVYQACLLDYVKAQRDLATQNKTLFDNSIATDAEKKINANQQEKVRTGSDINAAVMAYKSAHPQR